MKNSLKLFGLMSKSTFEKSGEPKTNFSYK